MKLKSVVSTLPSNCTKCLKCLKTCKAEAITLVDGRVEINKDNCINCGDCIKVCTNLALSAKGSTVYDINNYSYTVCLVPTSLLATQHDDESMARLLKAIKDLGFDEVVNLSHYEGKVYKETLRYVLKKDEKMMIASFCPVVNRLIALKYPSLREKIVNVNYPSVVAALDIRKKYQDKKNLGIFYIAECVSKLALAKYPYGNFDSPIDHALSSMDLFPLLNKNRNNEGLELDLANLGIVSCASHLISENYKSENILVASGTKDIMEVAELAEFGKLDSYDLLYLFKCRNGCIGGDLLWGNRFEAKKNILDMASRHTKQYKPLENLDLVFKNMQDDLVSSNNLSIKERIKFFNQVNEVLAKLPGFDCGACGYPSCRALATAVVKDEAKLDYCRLREVSEDESKGFNK